MGAERVGVTGAGVMGAEIAAVGAAAGLDVTLHDVSADALETARTRISKVLERFGATQTAIVELTTDHDELSDRDLVIEAVPERLELKAQVFRRLDEVTPPDTVLASNTSGLSITALGHETRRPGKVLGLHFFNPVSRMQLVELIRGEDTDADAVARATVVCERLGKTLVRVRECPGFLVNRVLVRALAEAYRAGGDPTAVDAAVVAEGPAPMGPFALGDLIGLDTLGSIQQDLERAYGDRFADGGAIAAQLEQGRLGRKSGAGFHGDAADRQSPPGSTTPDDVGSARAYYLGAVHEAALCLGDEVARGTDIDVALRLGAGWAEGPLSWADSFGLDLLVDEMNVRASAGSERFAPPAELASRASAGERFVRS